MSGDSNVAFFGRKRCAGNVSNADFENAGIAERIAASYCGADRARAIAPLIATEALCTSRQYTGNRAAPPDRRMPPKSAAFPGQVSVMTIRSSWRHAFWPGLLTLFAGFRRSAGRETRNGTSILWSRSTVSALPPQPMRAERKQGQPSPQCNRTAA